VKGERITNWVEVHGTCGRDEPIPCLTLERDVPGVADHGRRNPAGYVTLSLPTEGVFPVSALRRALDEYEAVTELS